MLLLDFFNILCVSVELGAWAKATDDTWLGSKKFTGAGLVMHFFSLGQVGAIYSIDFALEGNLGFLLHLILDEGRDHPNWNT